MVYEYLCQKCNTATDVIKVVADFDRIESCEKCGTIMERQFRPKIHLYGTAVQEAYFNHGLGQVVKGNSHAKQIAKDRKLIEVGNERPEKHLKVKLSNYD